MLHLLCTALVENDETACIEWYDDDSTETENFLLNIQMKKEKTNKRKSKSLQGEKARPGRSWLAYSGYTGQ
jgi:tRNA A37 threonylcarbamoyladenosine biosynthesis protein TsaE